MPSPYVARCAGAPYALGAYVLSRLCTESAYVPSSYVAAYVLEPPMCLAA